MARRAAPPRRTARRGRGSAPRARCEAAPGTAEAVHLLGLIAHQSGKLGEAIEHLRRAVALDAERRALSCQSRRDVPARRPHRRGDRAWPPRARARARSSRRAEQSRHRAITSRRTTTRRSTAMIARSRCAPDFAEAHSNRGNALRALKRLAGGGSRLSPRARRSNPRFAQAWNNLGTTLRDLKRPEEAEAAYRKALAANAQRSRHARQSRAGGSRTSTGSTRRPRRCAARSRVEPRERKLHLHLGSRAARPEQGRRGRRRRRQRALALNPEQSRRHQPDGPHRLRARRPRAGARALPAARSRSSPISPTPTTIWAMCSRSSAGSRKRSAAYLKALALDPKIAGVYVNLADSKKFAAGDPHLAAMEALAHERRPLANRPDAAPFRARQGLCRPQGPSAAAFEHLLARQCAQARADRL